MDNSLTFFCKLLLNKTDKAWVQIFRYTAVSGISSLADFAVLFFFTDIVGVHYLVSAVIAYSVGVVVNYALSVVWVFPFKKFQNKAAEFTLFVAIGVAGMGLNELLMWFFTDVVMRHYMVSKIISASIGFVAKYFARKKVLFS